MDGRIIGSEEEFHSAIAQALDFGPYYGNNLDALWDRLTTDVQRPIRLVWANASVSQTKLGPRFDDIVSVLQRVVELDKGLADVFEFELQS